ncbi:MAG: hypothetical protein BWZ06_01747 [Bacteroidetes bacterium ADurb.BinA261]|nr:MAG: hypothetical protein BWZ06_01747 [Bacteroidetes bacterium ADurb.BinA261]
MFRKFGRIIVSTRFGSAIGCKMLSTRQKRSNIRQRLPSSFTLKTFYTSFGYTTSQIGIFACSFHNTSPAGITRNVNHGGKRPVDAVRSGFDGCYSCRLFHHRQIPRTGFAQRNRKYRFITVNHILSEENRDSQTSGIYSYLLQLTNAFH